MTSTFARSVNPATGEAWAEYVEASPSDLEAIVQAAAAAGQEWRRLPTGQRASHLSAVAQVLRRDREALARLMTREMGKPITQSRAEVDKCAWLADYYAAEAAVMLAPHAIASDAARSYVCFEPLGTVLGIMPWNFPFWQALRFALPALAAGNAALLKHAPNVCGSALAIEHLMQEAGLPAAVFRTVILSNERTLALLGHESIAAVSLTGSTRAGREVAAAAGRHLKPAVLELGGSDAYVVLADADLDAAARICAASRLVNSGQSCIAAKRFVVVREILDAFVDLLTAELSKIRPGDPLDDATVLGPLARADLRANLDRQVRESVAAGARLVAGGAVPSGPGFFYPATLLTEVVPGMPAFDEELFGPVAAVVRAENERDAIRLANASRYGLGAAVLTRDVAHGEAVAARELEAGSCFVNGFVRSDPRLPFGGVKQSGYGRELGEFGLKSFVNVKTVWVA